MIDRYPRRLPDGTMYQPPEESRTAHEKRVEHELSELNSRLQRVEHELSELNSRLQRVEHELAWRRRYDPLRPFQSPIGGTR